MWLLLSAIALAQPPAVHQTFTGRVHLATDAPGGEAQVHPPAVIRDDEALAAFIDRVPTRAITKRNPAQPSDDPLLAEPELDWSRHMLVVAERDHMYALADLEVEHDGATLLVTVTLPDPGELDMLAAAHGIGTYTAVVVDRAESVRFTAATASPEQAQRP
ncbi:MAG: hypothetical protein ACI9K2_007272 [Myxococcota bacterium]|jgi:hypothetical protein